jgi:hypothetical protein
MASSGGSYMYEFLLGWAEYIRKEAMCQGKKRAKE